MELFTVVAIAALLAVYVTWLATRLRRLHSRVDHALTALTEAARRRAETAQKLALEPLLDSASAAVLQRATAAALAEDPDSWEARESELTKALRQLEPVTTSTWTATVAANRRLEVARQVYNDAVRDTLALRRARLPRGLRLADAYPRPRYFDIDTELQ